MRDGKSGARLLWSLAGGLAGATALGFLGQFAWWLDVIANFRLQFTVLAGVLFAAALVERRGRVALVAIVLTGVNGATLTPYFATAEAGADSLNVVSFNLQWRNTEDAGTVSFLKDQNADVLVLAEVTPFWRRELERLHDTFPHRFFGPDCRCAAETPHGLAVFSKQPWVAEGSISLSPGHRTYAVWLRFAEAQGEKTVFGVHMSKPFLAGEGDQKAEVAEFAKIIRRAGPRVILAGDFNMTPFSHRYQTFIRNAGLRRADGGFNTTWPSLFSPLSLPIDHVLVGPGISRASMSTGPRLASDHLPVVAKVSLR